MKTDYGCIGKIVVIRMLPGEDVIQGLKNAIKEYGFNSGVILSIIGTLNEVKLHYFLGRSQGIIHVSHSGHYVIYCLFLCRLNSNLRYNFFVELFYFICCSKSSSAYIESISPKNTV